MSEIQEITSVQNPRVKQVVKLGNRRERRQSGLYVIDEAREVERAIACGQALASVFFCPDLGGEPDRFTVPADVPRFVCPRAVFEKMAYRQHPGGVIAVAKQAGKTLAELRLGDCPLVLVAAAIEKPANLGAMLRTADGVGVDAVLVCDPVTDVYNPNVISSSTGTFFSVPTVLTDTVDAIVWLREKGLQVVCTTPDTDLLYTRVDLTRPTAVVMGSEKDGLPPEWLDASEVNVRIPMNGVADSLNVSVSAALVLYEALRQRTVV